MTWRSVVGDVVTRMPGVPGLVVRLWGETHLRSPHRAPPLISRVKSRLGYRMRRPVPMITGQVLEVDPFDGPAGGRKTPRLENPRIRSRRGARPSWRARAGRIRVLARSPWPALR